MGVFRKSSELQCHDLSDNLNGVALAALLRFIWMLTLCQTWLHDDAPAPSEALHELRCDDGLFWTL